MSTFKSLTVMEQ